MKRVLATALCEFRIAFRNRWVAIATAMMALFALVLAAAGAAPTGDVGVDRLSVIVASLTSLSVYLVPLLALLMSFDAVAGEVERGTLPLVLTYPVSRLQILLGKLLAHVAILGLATGLGYGVAGIAAIVVDRDALAVNLHLMQLEFGAVKTGARRVEHHADRWLRKAVARRDVIDGRNRQAAELQGRGVDQRHLILVGLPRHHEDHSGRIAARLLDSHPGLQ